MLDNILKEECGVFGIWGVSNPAECAYLGLFKMQHRGQETAGITSLKEKGGFMFSKTGSGIVNEVFNAEKLSNLKGCAAIGHVKQTTQDSPKGHAQPVVGDTQSGQVAVALNGLITNREELKQELFRAGGIFQVESGCDIILRRFARSGGEGIESRIQHTFRAIRPAYSAVMLTKNELIGVRDPWGVKPLEIGVVKEDSRERYVLASETVAFAPLNAEHVGEVKPGEIVVINDKGLRRTKFGGETDARPCILELSYLGFPSSFQFDNKISDGEIRERLGAQLYREHPVNADVVVGIPDASTSMALGFSYESGINFGVGFSRGHYTGKGFITEDRLLVGSKVQRKYTSKPHVFTGNRVVIVEDFILTGETVRELVKMARHDRAKEVHVRVGMPPYLHNCYLGVSAKGKTELIAETKSTEAIRERLGADSLGFLSMQGMLSVIPGNKRFCSYCFDGKEVVPRG